MNKEVVKQLFGVDELTARAMAGSGGEVIPKAVITYMTYDGASVIGTESVEIGSDGTRINDTARASDVQWNYTPDGWALAPNGAKNANALVNITEDRTVYAAYISTLRTYTVTFVRDALDGGGTLFTQDVAYGSTPVYGGSAPESTREGYVFVSWVPALAPVDGTNLVYTALFEEKVEPAVDLKYLIYTTDDENKTMTITGLNVANIVADKTEELVIPDTINGYHVIPG